MNKTIIGIILTILCIGTGIALAGLTQYKIPTDGDISTSALSITWLNGTAVSAIHWGTVNNTEWYDLEPINITNIGAKNVTLTLSSIEKSASIISLELTWNYTGTLHLAEWQIVTISQKIIATGAYTYTTVITATTA